MEKYKWKCMVLSDLGCMNNADFGGKNDEIALDVFIICQKLRHVQVTEKIHTHIPSE